VFIRAPFGVAMAGCFLMTWILVRGPRTGLSTGVQALVLMMLGTLVLVFAWPQLDAYIAGEVLPKARSYFTIGSATTRMWVNIADTNALFSSLWWTLPLSLVGPTPGEVLTRPVMLPFLVSGLVVFFLLLYAIQQAFRAPAGLPRKVLVLAWLPAMLVTLVTYVPFGIYNPGSGIRYASCFLLFLVFPWMLRSGVAAPAEVPGRSRRRGVIYDYRLAELR
jgi:hypothetical protein